MTRDEIFAYIRNLLKDSFGIAPERIKPEALLIQDLDLDSIDAIDMVVRLQDSTGLFVAEEALRQVRTVSDVVDLVEQHLSKAAGGDASGKGNGAAGVAESGGAPSPGLASSAAAQRPAAGGRSGSSSGGG